MPSDTTVTERPDTASAPPSPPAGGPAARRRKVAACAAAAAVVLAGVAAGGASGEAGRSSGRVPSPAAAAAPALDGAPAPAPVAVADRCRNSSDPACGPFRWDPAPAADRPLTIALEVVPAEPRAGEEVTVRVVAWDPDAPVTTNGGSFSWDDPDDAAAQIGYPYVVERGPARFGPWTPPVPVDGRLETAFTHTFSRPGTFRFSFAARSGDESDPGNPARHPYAGVGGSSVTIVVAPPVDDAARAWGAPRP